MPSEDTSFTSVAGVTVCEAQGDKDGGAHSVFAKEVARPLRQATAAISIGFRG